MEKEESPHKSVRTCIFDKGSCAIYINWAERLWQICDLVVWNYRRTVSVCNQETCLCSGSHHRQDLNNSTAPLSR